MEWSTEKEQERASAAARWLFDQVGIRGEWARLGGFWPQTCLRRGVWYRILSHDPQSRTLQLGDDVEELDVNLTYLKVRADLPEKTVVFSEGKWNSPPTGGDDVRCGLSKGARASAGRSAACEHSVQMPGVQ